MTDTMRRGLRRAALGMTLAGAFIASTPAAVPQEAPPAPSPEEAADRAKLNDLLAKARPIVEKIRGHTFEKELSATPMTREEFLVVQLRDIEMVLGGSGSMEKTARLLERLGVLPANTDLKALLAEYMPNAVAAKYDPFKDSIHFLPGISRTLQTMVHEVTHALDDERFDMSKQVTAFAGQLDRAFAYGALAEGSAQNVEYQFLMGEMFLTAPLENLRMQGEMITDATLRRGGRTPPAIALAFGAQYLEGGLFVETLRRTPAGVAQIDRAFQSPPDSTEQVLHPEKFLDGEAPVTITLGPPPEGGSVVIETTLGELATAITLMARGIDQAAARTAAAGWGGDRIALVSIGPEKDEGFVWLTMWDTETDAVEFYESLKKAFPSGDGKDGVATNRMITHRAQEVCFLEASMDAMPDLIGMARASKEKSNPANPRRVPTEPAPESK